VAAAISGEVTSDEKEGLAATPLLPLGEKVPEGRMRGLRALTAPAIFIPAGEKGPAAISGEVTSDEKEDLAPTPLLPLGEKVPEGRMRGLRAPTAPAIFLPAGEKGAGAMSRKSRLMGRKALPRNPFYPAGRRCPKGG